MKQGLFLSDLGIVNALGNSKTTVFSRLVEADRSGIIPFVQGEKRFHIGRASVTAHADNRLNALLLEACLQIRATLDRVVARYGSERIAVVIGSTDNGAEESKAALEHYFAHGSYPQGYSLLQQEAQLSAIFVAEYLQLHGPAFSISTACTSSASAIASARMLIESGLCDAAVVGGGDIVSQAVLLGFNALEAVDPQPCLPFSLNRKGINLGEGAALFVLSRDNFGSEDIQLLGCGESADAWHMTAPDPTGAGAERAMRTALGDAGLDADHIDYINLHGTGTDLNDAMESRASAAVFGSQKPCSSTKSLVGHTLGAAGAMELGFCWLALSSLNKNGVVPPHVWDGVADPELPALGFASVGTRVENLSVCMSNSYAFGGCNVSLIIGRPANTRI